jgi:glycosyltransferase involved in cell wall biosynthesis
MCARVLPIGRRSSEHYRRLGAPDWKMVESPYCVSTLPFLCEERDRERLRSESRRELGMATSDIGVVFAGKLSVRKGVHVLVEAAKSLPEILRRKIVLLFLGAGQERDALQAACEKTPAVRACFIGFRNQTELSPYYHGADLLCLPSIESETWGLVVNEALHHGLPCVVSEAVGCAADLIEPGVTGEIAANGEAASLAAAIERAARLAGDAETRARCRAKVATYTVERAAEGIAQAYWSVMKEKR